MPNFGGMSRGQYGRSVCTPSANGKYFEAFHFPIIEYMKKTRGKARVLDLGCGYGAQAEFFRGHGSVGKYAELDISFRGVAGARKSMPLFGWVVGNAAAMPLKSGSFDMCIGVNAMQNSPLAMAGAAYDALAHDGVAVLNFRLAGREENHAYFKAAVEGEGGGQAADALESKIRVKGCTFRLLGIDDGNYANIAGRQEYFYELGHVVEFLELCGFKVAACATFEFYHEQTPNLHDVVFAQKPGSRPDEGVRAHLMKTVGV